MIYLTSEPEQRKTVSFNEMKLKRKVMFFFQQEKAMNKYQDMIINKQIQSFPLIKSCQS
jgi:hypothetical protein